MCFGHRTRSRFSLVTALLEATVGRLPSSASRHIANSTEARRSCGFRAPFRAAGLAESRLALRKTQEVTEWRITERGGRVADALTSLLSSGMPRAAATRESLTLPTVIAVDQECADIVDELVSELRSRRAEIAAAPISGLWMHRSECPLAARGRALVCVLGAAVVPPAAKYLQKQAQHRSLGVASNPLFDATAVVRRASRRTVGGIGYRGGATG